MGPICALNVVFRSKIKLIKIENNYVLLRFDSLGVCKWHYGLLRFERLGVNTDYYKMVTVELDSRQKNASGPAAGLVTGCTCTYIVIVSCSFTAAVER